MTTEERLGKLECELSAAKRRNRWLLAVAVLAVAGLGLAWALTRGTPAAYAQGAAAGKKVIRANKFILEDEKGEIRVMLDVIEGSPTLNLSDEKGEIRVMLDVNKDGAGLMLSDEKGKPRAILAMTKEGPGLLLFDENGKARAALAVGGNRPGLLLSDENDKVIWQAP